MSDRGDSESSQPRRSLGPFMQYSAYDNRSATPPAPYGAVPTGNPSAQQSTAAPTGALGAAAAASGAPASHAPGSGNTAAAPGTWHNPSQPGFNGGPGPAAGAPQSPYLGGPGAPQWSAGQPWASSMPWAQEKDRSNIQIGYWLAAFLGIIGALIMWAVGRGTDQRARAFHNANLLFTGIRTVLSYLPVAFFASEDTVVFAVLVWMVLGVALFVIHIVAAARSGNAYTSGQPPPIPIIGRIFDKGQPPQGYNFQEPHRF